MEQSFKARLRSASPFLMNNGQLANPMNPFSKALKQLTAKRTKTDSDIMEIAKIEWNGSLYLLQGHPCIPGTMMEACVINASKRRKQGQQAKAGLYCNRDFPLEYNGPLDLTELWDDERFRFVANCRPQGRSTVIRTRPIFTDWQADIEVIFNDELLNRADIEQFLDIAGRDIGIGNWRPKFGRFMVEVP